MYMAFIPIITSCDCNIRKRQPSTLKDRYAGGLAANRSASLSTCCLEL